MKSLVFFALVSVAVAKPGYLGGLDHGLSSLSIAHQPAVAIAQPTYTVAQPIVHAAPVVQAAPVVHAAPVAVAKQATSYSSFQRIVHPVAVAQPVVHAAPVVSQPIVHAVAQPVVHSAPVVQTIAQPVVQKYLSLGSYGNGLSLGSYGHGLSLGSYGHGLSLGSYGHGLSLGSYGHGW